MPTFHLQGMHCASCVKEIEDALMHLEGVKKVEVNFAARKAEVDGDVDPKQVMAAVASLGYEATLPTDDGTEEHAERARFRLLFTRSIVAVLVGIPLFIDLFFPWMPEVDQPVFQWPWLLVSLVTFAVLWFSGGDIYQGAWQSLKKLRANMDTLIALGTGVAWLYSFIVILMPFWVPSLARHVYFDTSVLLLAFINFGQALEIRARGKTSQAIKRLIGLQPKTALVIRDGKEMQVPLEAVKENDLLRAYPGEKIAVDGEITEGESSIDESMLTGEPIAVKKSRGDAVAAGTLNKSGSFIYRATKVGKDTALARIIGMVQQAQNTKPSVAKLADKVSAVFVPIVISVAVITAIIWGIVGPEPKSAFVLITAVSVLVIACPCALGLATPISIMVGVGKAAEYGVLIRHGEALQQAAKLKTIVFDKTGTITQGKPSVTDIVGVALSEQEVLSIAAALEQGSEHPLAEAIRERGKNAHKDVMLSHFSAKAGHGVQADISGKTYYLGNARWMQALKIDLSAQESQTSGWEQQAKTVVYLADDKALLGVLAIADPIKKEVKQVVQQLQRQHVDIVLLSGDRQAVAEAVAKQVGIKHVIAEVLPDQKADHIKQLQHSHDNHQLVAMVGDGINDAPALATADVGFAIGTGTDVAIEAADIALMGESLSGVVHAIKLSKATLRNIKQNLFGAFIYNTAGIPIAAGILYPWTHWLLSPLIAGAAMALSSVTVVSNANRLRRFKLDDPNSG